MFICVYVRRIHVSILFTTVTSSLSNKKKKKNGHYFFKILDRFNGYVKDRMTRSTSR